MLWQEEENNAEDFVVPNDVVDLSFSIRCKTLPVDHGYVVSQALLQHLPWMSNEPQAAVHQIHVADSSHGWQRPEGADDLLLPSRRTRLILRMPAHRLVDCQQLVDQKLDIEGHELAIGTFKIKPLSKLTTVFARHIETDQNEGDEAFIQRIMTLLKAQDIAVKKMMSGLLVEHRLPKGGIYTRKLMLSGLSVNHSIRLQQQGLGELKLMGIGIFLPHKGIDAVRGD